MAGEGRSSAGSALLIVLLVTLAIVFVGIAFLALTQTEGGIARNESLAAQARYAAEAGARAVKGWFEQPSSAPGFPADPSTVVRARAVLDEADPYAAAPTPGGVQYKEHVDRDGDGRDDLFQPPHRGTSADTLLGGEDAPDMRIEDETVLAELSRALFGEVARVATGFRPRIRRIDVYAPPYLRVDGGWVRHGTGTIKVVAAVERVGADVEIVAQRTATLVLDEVDYVPSQLPGVLACGDAEILGASGLRWGALVALGRVELPVGPAVPPSFPRAVPDSLDDDPLWTADPAWVAEFSARLDPAQPIEDPWVRILARGPISGAPSGDAQPWAGPPPPGSGSPGPWSCCDRSNLVQHQGWIACPRYDYETWKGVARSGFKGAHYYAWQPGEGFRRDGQPPGQSLDQVLAETAGLPGLHFFDTADGRAPHDDDDDGRADNLTPPILLSGPWAVRGFLLLHAERLELSDVADTMPALLRAPGEPSVGGPAAWIDLDYPPALDLPFHSGSAGAWDAGGPEILADVAFHGLLVTSGDFVARGGGTIYGAIVARSVVLDGSVRPTRIFRDPSLDAGWPPAGWALPRFSVSRFAVD